MKLSKISLMNLILDLWFEALRLGFGKKQKNTPTEIFFPESDFSCLIWVISSLKPGFLQKSFENTDSKVHLSIRISNFLSEMCKKNPGKLPTIFFAFFRETKIFLILKVFTSPLKLKAKYAFCARKIVCRKNHELFWSSSPSLFEREPTQKEKIFFLSQVQ